MASLVPEISKATKNKEFSRIVLSMENVNPCDCSAILASLRHG